MKLASTPVAAPPSAEPAAPAASGTALADSPREALAREALYEARVALMMAFRFLDAALWHMPLEPADISRTLSTNGTVLHFGAERVCASYLDDENDVARDMLHAVLHCVFRHPFDKSHADVHAWSLACDITVEAASLEVAGQRFPTVRDEKLAREIAHLKADLGPLSPFKLYRAITGDGELDEMRLDKARANVLRELCRRDSHDEWAMWFRANNDDRAPQKPAGKDIVDAQDVPDENLKPVALGTEDGEGEGGSHSEKAPDGEAPQSAGESESANEESTSREPDGTETEDESADGGSAASSPDAPEEAQKPPTAPGLEQTSIDPVDEQAWEDIGRQAEIDLETYSKQTGDKAGGLMAALAVANRKPCDYAAFLRRFAAITEETKVNDDEFDYIFYTLGLERYGNMPLVEPLEYQETNRVREFVVALDTSGSCSGKLIRAFVTQTYEILCESNQFGHEVNVHIIQCDSRIQSDTKITSVRELEAFRDSFKIKGFGGTDFRPVFAYVDELVARGEFSNLKGLVYFTDGLGVYPPHPPAYDVAFAFIGDETTRAVVPPWAMKVTVDQDKLIESAQAAQ